MALPATENFNTGADPLAGGNWSQASGANGAWRAAANIGTKSSSGSAPWASVWTADSFSGDQYVQWEIPASNATGTDQNGGAVRIQSTGGLDCYLANARTTTIIRIYEVSSGTGTKLGADFTVTALVATDVIRLEISGSTLELFVNDVSQGTRTDSTHTGGSAGLAQLETAGNWHDNWEAGDLASGTSIPIFAHHYNHNLK